MIRSQVAACSGDLSLSQIWVFRRWADPRAGARCHPCKRRLETHLLLTMTRVWNPLCTKRTRAFDRLNEAKFISNSRPRFIGVA